MTYSDELDHLTRAVAALLEKPEQQLDDLGVQAALSSRKALLGLLAVQMAEAAPLDRSLTKPDLHRLAEHPVAAFIGTLQEYPRPHGEIAPSVLYSQPQETPAGALWLEVGRRSTLAQAEWQGSRKPLADKQAWSVVSDAAALADALARLDQDLSASAMSTGCGDLVQALLHQAPLRLAIAADQVKHLAVQGPRTVTPDRWRMPEPRVHPVTRDSDVPRALEALTALLRNARVLKPEHVQQIAVSLARVDVRLNHGVATDLARELAAVARTPRRAACPFHGERRPLLQAGELSRWVSRPSSSPAAGPGMAVLQLVESVAGLQIVTLRQLKVGNWLVPDPNPDARNAWRTWNHSLPEPEILNRLRGAAQCGEILRRGTTHSTPQRLPAGLVSVRLPWRLPRPVSPQLRPTR